jgi:hypothetical protein
MRRNEDANYSINNDQTLEFVRKCMVNDGMRDCDEKHVGYYLWDFDAVWESKHNQHRWWNSFDRVIKLEDKFIQFDWASTTGDNSIFDMGWEFDENSVIEVEPFEKVIIEYKPIKIAP